MISFRLGRSTAITFRLCKSALTQRFSTESSNRRICNLMMSKKESAVGKERADINQTPLQAQSVRRGAPLASLRANPAAPRWWL